MMDEKIPLPKALAIIVASTLLISGSAYSLLHGVHIPFLKKANPYIQIISQAGVYLEPLKSSYLAELMGICYDQPILLSDLDCMAAAENLLKSPLIKKAEVKKIPPDGIHVNYEARMPVALLLDRENTALDEEGFLLPFSPFFAPKRLPEIYLGIKNEDEPFSWSKPLQHSLLAKAFEILELLAKPALENHFTVRRIDVSKAEENSCGKKEIVLIIDAASSLDESKKPSSCHYLRLSVKNYAQELGNYLELRQGAKNSYVFSSQKQIIDLRLEGMAFIDPLMDETTDEEADFLGIVR